MPDEECERLSQEIEEWKKLKEDVKAKAEIVTLENYDEDSMIFDILKIDKKKDKKKIVRTIAAISENTFNRTFNEMNDYFEKTLKTDYVKIEDISVFQNMFGMIADRAKSWKAEIKSIEKQIVDTKKKIVKPKDYDEQQNLKFSLYGCDDRIKESAARVRILEDLHRQLKFDIKSLETTKYGRN